jgi:hypothetical protein
MLALTAICGALLALTQWLAPLTVVAIAFLLLSIAAHVAGNAIGTQLRRNPAPEDAVANSLKPGHIKQLTAEHFAPATRLSQSNSLGWPLFAVTMAGLVGGGIVGAYWVIVTSAEQPAELNVVVGVVACSVLGGVFSFVAAGFLQVTSSAIWQALASPRLPEAARGAPTIASDHQHGAITLPRVAADQFRRANGDSPPPIDSDAE